MTSTLQVRGGSLAPNVLCTLPESSRISAWTNETVVPDGAGGKRSEQKPAMFRARSKTNTSDRCWGSMSQLKSSPWVSACTEKKHCEPHALRKIAQDDIAPGYSSVRRL
jgi:hypothetical protein